MINKERNTGSQKYIKVDIANYPKTPSQKFAQVIKRSLGLELFRGLGITFSIMYKALFKGEMHTVKYPMEKLPLSQRYRAVHNIQRLLGSGESRCIGCGLCEKICISNCIRIDTQIDKNSRKNILEYSINLGRCIYCGFCAEVCPELAIVHGQRYENASEQRAHFVLNDDLLTPIDLLKNQKEYSGYGSVSIDADEKIKKTPLAY